MPRLCWMMMQWGQRAIWGIFRILEKYNEPRQLYVYISGITGKKLFHSIPMRYYMPRLCWMIMSWEQRATWAILEILDKGEHHG